MSIDNDSLAAIRERVDIVALVGKRVALRRSGRRFVGICPFHAEKSPSLSVAGDKKLFHCFGCGAGGDAIAFLMRADGLDFQAACHALAADSGVPMQPVAPHLQRARDVHRLLSGLNGRLAAAMAAALWSPAGAAARHYLKERGIPPEIARTYQLGWGPPLPRLLEQLQGRAPGAKGAKDVAQAEGVDPETLAQTGVLSDPGGHFLCHDRLVFPIAEADGKVAGFGARRLRDGGGGPKYINSCQSPIFNKGRQLFGLAQAARDIRQLRTVIVCEGYLDVLALAGAGIGHAVAALGTALTADHAHHLRRLAPAAQLLFDADRAGRSAAWRATGTLMAAGVRVEVVVVPAGEDPASLAAKHGPAALRQACTQTTPAIEFFMAEAFDQAPGVEARAAAAWRLAPLIALCDELERDLYVHRLAKRVGLPVDALRRHLEAAPPLKVETAVSEAAAAPASPLGSADVGPAAGRPSAGAAAGAAGLSPAMARELGYLREVLLYPSLRARFGELADFSGCQAMADTWEALADSAEPTAAVLATTLSRALGDRDLQNALRGVAIWRQSQLDADDERANRTFADVLRRMKESHLDLALREVVEELRAVATDGEAVDRLLQRKRRLSERRQALRRGGLGGAAAAPSTVMNNQSQDTQQI